MSDDLPTFDRPIKAYSGFNGGGNFDTCVLLQIKSAVLMFMRQRYGLLTEDVKGKIEDVIVGVTKHIFHLTSSILPHQLPAD